MATIPLSWNDPLLSGVTNSGGRSNHGAGAVSSGIGAMKIRFEGELWSSPCNGTGTPRTPVFLQE